jgi:hypothetical protein
VTLSDERISIIRQEVAPLPELFHDQFSGPLLMLCIPIHQPRLPMAVSLRWYAIAVDEQFSLSGIVQMPGAQELFSFPCIRVARLGPTLGRRQFGPVVPGQPPRCRYSAAIMAHGSI